MFLFTRGLGAKVGRTQSEFHQERGLPEWHAHTSSLKDESTTKEEKTHTFHDFLVILFVPFGKNSSCIVPVLVFFGHVMNGVFQALPVLAEPSLKTKLDLGGS